MEHRASIQDFGLACFEQSRPILRFVRAGGPSTSGPFRCCRVESEAQWDQPSRLLRTLGLIKRPEPLVGFEVQFQTHRVRLRPDLPRPTATLGRPYLRTSKRRQIRYDLANNQVKRSLDGSTLKPGLLHIRLGDQWTAVFARVNAAYAMEIRSSIFELDFQRRPPETMGTKIESRHWGQAIRFACQGGIRLIGPRRSVSLLASKPRPFFTSQHHFIDPRPFDPWIVIKRTPRISDCPVGGLQWPQQRKAAAKSNLHTAGDRTNS